MKKQVPGGELAKIAENRPVFVQELLWWNRHENHRPMPWKGEKDPYRIWLSEIILQQTRVEQGLKYYQNFTRTYPNIHSLARAPEAEVFKLWEGLGYYSRCRNLIATARFISAELGGVFPADYESILALKGVGSYTASAIASFAYNLPHAVVDGNVFRVLSRVFGIVTPIDSTSGKKEFTALASALLPINEAGIYNQAIMDFGAMVCKPVPLCAQCFYRDRCLAFSQGKQDLLPVKEKKTKVKERWLHYFVVVSDEEIAVRQRMDKDIWQNLFEFLPLETGGPLRQEALFELFKKQYGLPVKKVEDEFKYRQKLSHQTIHFHFYRLSLRKKPVIHGFQWVQKTLLKKYAFPRTLQQYIQEQLA